MDKKKELASFEETKNAPDIFSFSEKENEKQFLNENFVFNSEDNKDQTGLDSNYQQEGLEDNDTDLDNHEHFEEHKIEQEDLDKFSQQSAAPAETSAASSSSASASTSSSTAAVNPTVATVAGVTTTAVVILVGGGIALGQVFERPNICQFTEVSAVQNTVQFNLQIGNTEFEATSLEGGDSCDIIVELLCPSDPAFVNNYPIANYGQVQGVFTDLKYETEYTLNVYQNQLIDVSKEYLLPQSYSVVTGMNSGISITAEYDPFNNIRYFATVNYSGDLSVYEYLALGIYDPELQIEEQTPEAEYMYTIQLDKSLEGRYELVCGDLPDYDQVYGIDLFGDRPIGTQQQDDFPRDVLLTTQINFKQMTPSECVIKNQAYFESEYNGDTTFYYTFVGADSTVDTVYYDAIDITVSTIVTTSDPSIQFAEGAGDTIYAQSIREYNTRVDFNINFGNYSEYDNYWVSVKIKNSNSPSDDSMLLWEDKVNFSEVHNKPKAAINSAEFVQFTTYHSNSYVTGLRLALYDPRNVVSNLTMNIYYVDYSQDTPEVMNYDYTLSKNIWMSGYWVIDDWDFYDYGVEFTLTIKGDTDTVFGDELYTGVSTYPEIPEQIQYEGSVTMYMGENDMMVSVYVKEYSDLSYYTNWRLVITNKEDTSIVYNETIVAVNEAQTMSNPIEQGVTYQVETYATTPGGEAEQLIFMEDIMIQV